jgi:hypothetical protein
MNKEEFVTTYKVFKNRKEDLQRQIHNLEIEMESIKEQYVEENTDLKPGDKVMVKYKRNIPKASVFDAVQIEDAEDLFFIKSAHAFFDGSIVYGFWKSKKDGTQSSQRMRFYNNDIKREDITKL